MILRDYQAEMAAEIRTAWSSGSRRVLGVLPTGGGKTEVAIELVRADARSGSRALVLVERKVLCRQWTKRLRLHGCNHVGILQGENTIALSAPIIVATAQSIRTRGVPEDVSLIVIDESHIWHETHDVVLGAAPGARVLGLTATPLREGLGLRFDRMVVGATIRELIAGNYLVRPRYFAPTGDAIEEALKQVSIRAGDYATEQLSQAMRSKSIIGDVVGTWRRRGEDRQTIAFAVDKAHAAQLCGEFVATGVAAEVVIDDTGDGERDRIFAAFDAKTTRVVVSVGVLAIGFDSPAASCAILARPTMSTSLHIQQGGRVLRPCEGKTDALILDHAANTMRHGLLEDFIPPADLSMVDARTDKRSRRELPEAWVCKRCDAINALGTDICADCGEPKRRHTTAVILDGELVEVDVVDGLALPGPTPEAVRDFYLMCRWHSEAHALKDGWGFYATKRRFGFDDDDAKRWIAWSWRDMDPQTPDAATARWFTADRIASRYRNRATQNA